MRINSTHILLAFGIGLGLTILLSFPAGSSGAVRSELESSPARTTIARFNEPDIGGSSHVIIDKSKHSLTLLRDGETPVVLKAQGAYAMKPGVFEVSRKEENPLWQAPPTYFLRRGLAVPAEGTPERSMRGALGAQALFLNQDVAIHSGPLWNDDVGGVKLSSADMALLFKVIGVGTKVEVR
jgi:hypothetical protein